MFLNFGSIKNHQLAYASSSFRDFRLKPWWDRAGKNKVTEWKLKRKKHVMSIVQLYYKYQNVPKFPGSILPKSLSASTFEETSVLTQESLVHSSVVCVFRFRWCASYPSRCPLRRWRPTSQTWALQYASKQKSWIPEELPCKKGPRFN